MGGIKSKRIVDTGVRIADLQQAQQESVSDSSVPSVPSVPNFLGTVPRNTPEIDEIPRNIPNVPSVPNVPNVPSVPRNSRAARSRERHSLSQLSAALPSQLVDDFKTYAHMSRRSVADVLEQAVYVFLNPTSDVPNVPRNVPNVPRNVSMMIDDVEVSEVLNIISHQYAELTGKTFNEADRTAALGLIQTTGRLDQATVRTGILLGLVRTKHPKINSFRYFLGPIAEAAAMPAGVEDYGNHLARKLKTKNLP